MISYTISRTFTKPILEIKKVSEKKASVDFSDRIKSRSKDEMGKLVETINYMGQELSKIDQLRKDLIANVSHELRTPLSLIHGYAETIKDVSGKDGKLTQEQADEIYNAIKNNQANCDGTGSAAIGRKYGAGFGLGSGMGNGQGAGRGAGMRNGYGMGAGMGAGRGMNR